MNYIEIMERVLEAYTLEHIRKYTETVKQNGIEEHGFPRLAANLGILIAHGRKTELKADFEEMMEICCSTMADIKNRNGGGVGNDFSVKEIIFCLMEIEKAEVFSKETTDRWRAGLSRIEPYSTYHIIAEIPPKRINNWAAFGAASEQVRKYAGIGCEDFFINNQIESQLLSFDENGMYRDPHEPMVYEFVTRLQLAAALYFGYDGKCRERLEKYLLKSADITLRMQSVTGEIPFGGRSNQFLHNETFFAALCEFYASWFKKLGDETKAGMFKNAARIAVESILPWLSEDKIRHVKNYYPTDSMYGCEDYAYFDKYMVTTASWLYLAHIMSDNDIKEVPCPVVSQNYICQTSEHFHKVFVKFGDYFAEFDTNADNRYDASGLGRIHKCGVPSALCLSVPFSKEPNYGIDIKNPSGFSICAGIKIDGEFVYAFENSEHRLVEQKVTDSFAEVKTACVIQNNMIIQTVRLSADGVQITAEGQGVLAISVPLFFYDGQTEAEITGSEKFLEVKYKGFVCKYVSDCFVNENKVYANRNGHYKAYSALGNDRVSLKISL